MPYMPQKLFMVLWWKHIWAGPWAVATSLIVIYGWYYCNVYTTKDVENHCFLLTSQRKDDLTFFSFFFFFGVCMCIREIREARDKMVGGKRKENAFWEINNCKQQNNNC